jgi:hypothetical protein
MEAPARDTLTVFVEGEELPGVIVYGLRRPCRAPIEFPGREWHLSHEPQPFRLYGETWEVVGWDLALAAWPTSQDWPGVVQRTLSVMVAAGCVVAWLGAEGCPFSDPPDLFSPDWMDGGVLAALTSQGDFRCPVNPDEPLRYLSAADLELLRARATGLADASDGES